jgi:hypothetical protein
MFAQTEISERYLVRNLIQDDIVEFQVPVNDVAIM